MKRRLIPMLGIAAALTLSACAAKPLEPTVDTPLSVTGGESVVYQCEGNAQVTVKYYGLSDGSLSFAKVMLPDGQIYTLPQAVSGSGVRFSDGISLSWQSKGKEGFVDTLNDQGKWQPQYRQCVMVESAL
ncbi:hypothetical protein VST7929_03203 [Vibrio stylophorae]|uniref:C-type lysozyme inhibitor domain-containing protein n=1 Tax=Vibrio stylophorae TaxID=659351 RepID=A0ABM8ZXZ6_9VIBR|nr:MliC family protein [Vibrio stylophorae]CAH0535729.1 hypothetical protein VST7929_03203 [Vibrio stylophorae]